MYIVEKGSNGLPVPPPVAKDSDKVTLYLTLIFIYIYALPYFHLLSPSLTAKKKKSPRLKPEAST